MTEFNLAQNEEIKKITSWAAILFAPTLVGTVYGMNFDDIPPELHWTFGYPFALLLMVGMGVGLYGGVQVQEVVVIARRDRASRSV